MELLFETRHEIMRVYGQLYFHQCKPKIHPEPVLPCDSPVDEQCTSCHGSVLHDGGRYRMWYQARPKGPEMDTCLVGYAESDDGVTWRKPVLNQIEFRGSKANNLVDLGVGCPSVFIDPTAPASHRYRATGCVFAHRENRNPDVNAPARGSYFTFHSSDGFHWIPDSRDPIWPWMDEIFSIWHPGRNRGEVLFKWMSYMNGMVRRSWYNATLKEGVWSSDYVDALVPDDYDDVLARSKGYVSADYYDVCMMPAGMGMVGFISQFRHRFPFDRMIAVPGVQIARWGETDVTLAYQPKEGSRWLHTPGRPDFLTHGEVPWARSGWYLGSNVTECGDEQRMYVTGALSFHMRPQPEDSIMGSIGFVSWPKWRLFEFKAQPSGELDINLGVLTEPCELVLNYKALSGGSIHAQIFSVQPPYTLEDIDGRTKEDAIPLTGDSLGEVVRWRNGSVIQPSRGRKLTVRLFMEDASAFAYELRPAR